MAIYQMKAPASPAVITMKFLTYNAAIDFSSKSGTMKPTKPYKRIISIDGVFTPIWCVTMPAPKPGKAEYIKIDDTTKYSEHRQAA